MWQCHDCRLPLSLELIHKNRLCPNCGSDLHCCKNCIHFDESLSSKCKEPSSPWVSNRETQNNCGFFEHKPATASPASPAPVSDTNAEAEKGKEAFRALFRDL